MKGSTIGLIVVSAVTLLICGVFAFMYGSSDGTSVLGSPRGSARASSTLSNVKQFSLGIMIYSTDYDDRYPVQMTDGSRLRVVVDPYVKNPSIYKTLNPNGGTVEANDSLAGAPSTEVIDPDESVMLFETNDWPDNRRVVSYADTHAKHVTGFDQVKDTNIDFTSRGQQIMDDLTAELEAAEHRPRGAASNSLGMPGG